MARIEMLQGEAVPETAREAYDEATGYGPFASLAGAMAQQPAPAPAAPAAPAAAAADDTDPFEMIEKLHKLQEMGAISQEEFDAKKADLLSKI